MMFPPFIASFNSDKLKFFKADMETTNTFSLALCDHEADVAIKIILNEQSGKHG